MGLFDLNFSFTPVALGVGLGLIGFAPMLAVVALVRFGRIRASVGKGIVSLAVSYAFSMAGMALTWVFTPEHVLSVAAGYLVGFLAAWAVLAALSMSR